MEDERFTEEALKAQDGKKVPLTLEFGGPVVGEATLRYDSETGSLIADMQVTDPQAAEILGKGPSAIIFRKEN
jgi:hypothetical protein